jgi:hypothetical protein
MEAIMAVYPRHKAVVDKFIARGVVLGIGPFTDLGNMAIFKTRAEAEAFSKEDAFILEGFVKSVVIKDLARLAVAGVIGPAIESTGSFGSRASTAERAGLLSPRSAR